MLSWHTDLSDLELQYLSLQCCCDLFWTVPIDVVDDRMTSVQTCLVFSRGKLGKLQYQRARRRTQQGMWIGDASHLFMR